MNIEAALRTAYRAGLNCSNAPTDEDSVVTNILDGIELRRFSVDDWIIDVKQVRVIKSRIYGEPYVAAAHISFNGCSAYIDTLISKDSEPFSKNDMRSLTKAARVYGAEHLGYERIKNFVKRDEVVVL